jgi:preprotein translocase subunit SecF
MSLSLTEQLDSFVRKHSDRQLMMLPAAIFLIAVLIIAFTWATTGAPVKLGMEFKGGTMISLRRIRRQLNLRKNILLIP